MHETRRQERSEVGRISAEMSGTARDRKSRSMGIDSCSLFAKALTRLSTTHLTPTLIVARRRCGLASSGSRPRRHPYRSRSNRLPHSSSPPSRKYIMRLPSPSPDLLLARLRLLVGLTMTACTDVSFVPTDSSPVQCASWATPTSNPNSVSPAPPITHFTLSASSRNGSITLKSYKRRKGIGRGGNWMRRLLRG